MVHKDTSKVVADLRAMLDGDYVAPPPEAVDLETVALYAGLSRVALPDGPTELMPGLTLRPTYAHFFTSPVVAFAPPHKPSAPHPAPWHRTRNGGSAETVTVEMCLAEGARPWTFSRVDTIRFVAGLIRLLAASPARIAVLSSVAFSEVVAAEREPALWELEQLAPWPTQTVKLDEDFLEIVRRLLQPSSVVIQDDDVYRAFSLLDSVWWLPSLNAQMVVIWTVAETLMRPGRFRTGEQLAKLMRAYTGRGRSHGDRVYNEVTRLYQARGSATHAGRLPKPEDVQASFYLVRDVMLRAFLEGERPPLPEAIVPLAPTNG
jgi:hypothetical protein